MSSKVTPEAIQDYRSGIPIQDILVRYGVSKTQFYRQLKKEQLPQREQGPSESSWAVITAEYESGKTLAALEEAHHVSIVTLSLGLKKRGIKIRKPSDYTTYNDFQKQQAIANYQNGMTVEKAGEFCGVSYTTVYFWLEAAGVPIRSQVIYGGNRDFFKTIDNERAAYWFGFLAADGNISRGRYLRILLSQKDRSHLLLFQKQIGHIGPIKDFSKVRNWPDRPPKIYHQSRLTMSMSRACKDLRRHGLLELKSGDPRPLDKLDQEMFRHFLRGYFDGDGSIGAINHKNWVWYVCGKNPDFLEYLAKRMICVDRTNPHKSGQYRGWIYRIRYTGNRIVPTICHWLYQDATVFLERKHELAQEALCWRLNQRHWPE